MSKYEEWIEENLPKQQRLTDAVIIIIENILKSENIEYLSVSGRTKTKKSVVEKIKRKGYKKPAQELTDLSGIRIIVYFESEIAKVSDVITRAFNVDTENSLNQDDRLSIDQIGYRSVHFVCDLGKERTLLPEFVGLSDLKFEFQVRTLLQHAWAELAHDRNYKFSGKLPPDIERSLFLYAGMLEIADKGFDELSDKIDKYVEDVHQQTKTGEFNYELDSISLPELVESWCESQNIELIKMNPKAEFNDLLNELNAIDIKTASQLNEIIPKKYADVVKGGGNKSTIFGYVRDWILIKDWRKLLQNVDINWIIAGDQIYRHFFDEEEFRAFKNEFDWEEDFVANDDED
jgi:putative GTP pyrophosphokinase